VDRFHGERVAEDLAVAVEDADVQGLGVEIDATVVAVLVRVESHWFSPCADVRVFGSASSLLRVE
jgi:hypothetical protein